MPRTEDEGIGVAASEVRPWGHLKGGSESHEQAAESLVPEEMCLIPVPFLWRAKFDADSLLSCPDSGWLKLILFFLL